MKHKGIFLLDLYTFVCLFFLCGEIYFFSINNTSIYISSLLFIVLFIILAFKRAFSFKYLQLIIPYSICIVLSSIINGSINHNIMKTIGLITNFIFISFTIASYIKYRTLKKFLCMTMNVVSLLSVLFIIQNILYSLDVNIPFLNVYNNVPCLFFSTEESMLMFFSFSLCLLMFFFNIYGDKKCLIALILNLLCCIFLPFLFIMTLIILLSVLAFNLFNKYNIKKYRFLGIISICFLFILILSFIMDRNYFVLAFEKISLSKSFDSLNIIDILFGVDLSSSEAIMAYGAISFFALALVFVFGFLKLKNHKCIFPITFSCFLYFILMIWFEIYSLNQVYYVFGIVLGLLFLYRNKKKVDKVYINGIFLTNKKTGIQRLCYEFCSRLQGERYEILIPNKVDIDLENIKIKTRRIGHFKGVLFEQISLPLFMLFKKNVVLWNFENVGPILYPSVTMIHDLLFYEKDYYKGKWCLLMRVITTLNVLRYEKIICPSNFTKNRILHFFPSVDEKDIVVVHPAYNHIFSYGQKPYKLPVDNYYLSVSSILKNKNFKYIIDLAKLRPQGNFVIIGRKEKLSRLFETIPDNVFFTGYVQDEELMYLYKNCLGFISPSLYEGFGVPPLEALGFGCEKVYISSIPVYKEIYQNSVVYFSPYDVDDLNKRLNDKYIVDFNNRDLLLKECTWENFTSLFLERVDC